MEYIPMAQDFNTNYDVEQFDNKDITHRVVNSISTESVYVTYYYADRECKVRFSNHSCNAVKFGDVLNGFTVTKDEILAHLGLKKRVFVPKKKLMIATRMVKKKELCNYKEAEITIKEMYELGAGADLSQYKGKLAKDSNYLILTDRVNEYIDTTTNFLGQKVQIGTYIYE